MTPSFYVYRVSDLGFGEQRGAFETFEAAHGQAVAILETEGGRLDIMRGDSLVWDSRAGRIEA